MFVKTEELSLIHTNNSHNLDNHVKYYLDAMKFAIKLSYKIVEKLVFRDFVLLYKKQKQSITIE